MSTEGGPGHWIGVWTIAALIVASVGAVIYFAFKWAHEQFMQ